MTEEEIRKLSDRHEIGAHTLSHPRLSRLPREEAQREIVESKKWLEGITGRPCTMFCYPKGDFDAGIVSLVREAGFEGARTVEELRFDASDPFTLPTTLYATAFPVRKEWDSVRKILDPLGPLRARMKRLWSIGVSPWRWGSWLSMSKKLFLKALKRDAAFFHLWGHSWQLDQYGMWNDLNEFLQFVRKYDVISLTNRELVRKLKDRKDL